MPVSLGESDERYSCSNENVLLAQLRAGDEVACWAAAPATRA
jgi:hypothetical protein